jgi:hypothetical protein
VASLKCTAAGVLAVSVFADWYCAHVEESHGSYGGEPELPLASGGDPMR